MTDHHAHQSEAPEAGGSPGRGHGASSWVVRLLMIALLAVGGYYVIAEHGAHLLSAWPLLILLACPLMHIFMHGGHGGHSGHGGGDARRSDNG